MSKSRAGEWLREVRGCDQEMLSFSRLSGEPFQPRGSWCPYSFAFREPGSVDCHLG